MRQPPRQCQCVDRFTGHVHKIRAGGGDGADEKCSLRQKIIVLNAPLASIHYNRSASRVINHRHWSDNRAIQCRHQIFIA